MKPLSKTESLRLERMWNAESGEEERMKAKAEATVQEVLRRAEEKFQAQTGNSLTDPQKKPAAKK